MDNFTDYVKMSIAQITGKDIGMVSDITYPVGLRPIKINGTLMIDGFRVCIAGKSDDNVILKSFMPLIASKDIENYLKKLILINYLQK